MKETETQAAKFPSDADRRVQACSRSRGLVWSQVSSAGRNHL